MNHRGIAVVLLSLVCGGCGVSGVEPVTAPRTAPETNVQAEPRSSSLPACLGLGPKGSKGCELPATHSSGAASDGVSLLGRPLDVCSTDPMTGWFRDGRCRTDATDRGVHVVCATLDDRFLEFTAQQGNDLSTPAPEYGFPGLRAGDRWCLCAARWDEARRAGVAPAVVFEATDDAALRTIDRSILERHAVRERS